MPYKDHILIVDDDVIVRTMLDTVLSSEGYSVRAVDSGEQCLALAQTEPPDLILLDLYMDGMDGFEVLRRLHNNPDCRGTPIIFLSAASEVEQRTQGLLLGAVDFITKPFHNAELLARVRTHLELRRLRISLQQQASDLQASNALLQSEIAQRREVGESLRRRNAFVDALLNAIPAPVFYKDADMRYVGCNHAFENFYGLRQEELTGNTVFDITPAELARTYHAKDMELIEKGGVQLYEFQVITKQGVRRDVVFHKATYTDSDGRVAGLVGVVIDITDRKKAEEEIRSKNRELERFTYTVSHDLRSPLVTIRTFLPHLVDDLAMNSSENAAQDLALINTAAEKMHALLEELLMLWRAGRSVQIPEAVPLQDVISEALDLVAGRIDRRGVKVDFPGTSLIVRGEHARLVAVFQNLIDNAVKFMGDQAEPRIEIQAQNHDDEIHVCVCDNGMGIDSQHAERLFDVFEKLDRNTEGAGMGLALVKRIAEAHGGRVWVESDGPGTGACFWFELPGK